MAQYFTDFSGYTVGVEPSDWSERFLAPGSTITVEADGTATGGQVLRIVLASHADRILAWDAIDSDPDRADAEVVFKWIVTDPEETVHSIGVGVRGSGGFSSETGYRLGAFDLSGGMPGDQSIEAHVNGAATTLDSAGIVINPGTWYWTRGRANGTTLQTKTWEDGSAEPGSWALTVVDSSVTAAGWVGIFTAVGGTTYEVDVLGVGTAGDTAPTEEATGGAAVELSAELAATSAAQAEIEVTRQPAATLASEGDLTASLAVTRPLAASLSASSELAATLQAIRPLAAALAAESAAAAAVQVTRHLGASLASTSATNASLQVTRRLAASLPATSAFVVNLDNTGAKVLGATLAGSSSFAAALQVNRTLSAALAGTSSLAASLKSAQAIEFSAELVGGSTLAATLVVTRPLGAELAGAGASEASLEVHRTLAAALAADSDVASAVVVTRQLGAELAAESDLAVALLATIPPGFVRIRKILLVPAVNAESIALAPAATIRKALLDLAVAVDSLSLIPAVTLQRALLDPAVNVDSLDLAPL